MVRPELLADELSGIGEVSEDAVKNALKSGDGRVLCALLSALYDRGVPIAEICDGAIRAAMTELGDQWEKGNKEDAILAEHRATGLCLEGLSRLRAKTSPPPARSPIAVGGTPPDDPYVLPTWMVATVLADLGIHVTNLGASLPVDLLLRHAKKVEADLLWLSVSVSDLPPGFADSIASVLRQIEKEGRHLMVGGRAVEAYSWPASQALHLFRDLTEMAAFVRGFMISRQRESMSAFD